LLERLRELGEEQKRKKGRVEGPAVEDAGQGEANENTSHCKRGGAAGRVEDEEVKRGRTEVKNTQEGVTRRSSGVSGAGGSLGGTRKALLERLRQLAGEQKGKKGRAEGPVVEDAGQGEAKADAKRGRTEVKEEEQRSERSKRPVDAAESEAGASAMECGGGGDVGIGGGSAGGGEDGEKKAMEDHQRSEGSRRSVAAAESGAGASAKECVGGGAVGSGGGSGGGGDDGEKKTVLRRL
jgi:hypothetical protein